MSNSENVHLSPDGLTVTSIIPSTHITRVFISRTGDDQVSLVVHGGSNSVSVFLSSDEVQHIARVLLASVEGK